MRRLWELSVGADEIGAPNVFLVAATYPEMAEMVRLERIHCPYDPAQVVFRCVEAVVSDVDPERIMTPEAVAAKMRGIGYAMCDATSSALRLDWLPVPSPSEAQMAAGPGDLHARCEVCGSQWAWSVAAGEEAYARGLADGLEKAQEQAGRASAFLAEARRLGMGLRAVDIRFEDGETWTVPGREESDVVSLNGGWCAGLILELGFIPGKADIEVDHFCTAVDEGGEYAGHMKAEEDWDYAREAFVWRLRREGEPVPGWPRFEDELGFAPGA